MTQPLSAVVRVATSPAQAKIFVALLQAEGIPAYIEGDSLADEFAMSRRMLNLIGTEVKVPTSSLERAREILATVEIDPAELEQQALAAAGGEIPVPAAPPPPQRVHRLWPLVTAIGAAVVFLGLWLAALEANAAAKDPRFQYEQTASGLREIRRSDRRLLRMFEDKNRNGLWDSVMTFGLDGKVTITYMDADEDGSWEGCIETHGDGLTAMWFDVDGDGLFEEGRVNDTQSRQLQTISWQPGVGYVIKKP